MTITVIHDLKESNGKTIKENNMELQHNIPIGTLVEYKTNDPESDYFGVRLFVAEHARDCDGTPLYNLSSSKKLIRDMDELKEDDFNSPALKQQLMRHYRGMMEGGFSEESLEIINL